MWPKLTILGGFFLRGDGGKLIIFDKVNEYWLRRIEWQTVKSAV